MQPSEAEIRKAIDLFRGSEFYDIDGSKYLNLAVWALNKQLPKAKKLDDKGLMLRCTICGTRVDEPINNRQIKFCYECGQTLKQPE